MREDFKAALRSLASSRTFTAVALLVLTLGIGASTAIFSVVDAVVLRALEKIPEERFVSAAAFADALEAAANPLELLATTPNVDALAARGLLYTHAWSNAPVCAPARTTPSRSAAPRRSTPTAKTPSC